MRGISTVIAAVLVLLIVVSLLSLTYVWSTYIFKSAETSTTTQLSKTIEEIQSDFDVITLAKMSETEIIVYVRNIGVSDIDLDNIAAYIDNNEVGLDCQK